MTSSIFRHTEGRHTWPGADCRIGLLWEECIPFIFPGLRRYPLLSTTPYRQISPQDATPSRHHAKSNNGALRSRVRFHRRSPRMDTLSAAKRIPNNTRRKEGGNTLSLLHWCGIRYFTSTLSKRRCSCFRPHRYTRSDRSACSPPSEFPDSLRHRGRRSSKRWSTA